MTELPSPAARVPSNDSCFFHRKDHYIGTGSQHGDLYILHFSSARLVDSNDDTDADEADVIPFYVVAHISSSSSSKSPSPGGLHTAHDRISHESPDTTRHSISKDIV